MGYLLRSIWIKGNLSTMTSSRSLCQMYRIHKSTTTPYNPYREFPMQEVQLYIIWVIKDFKQGSKSQVGHNICHLWFLLTVYTMPHATTEFQPYELMLAIRLQYLVTHGFRLSQYQEGQPTGKASCLGQQLDTMVAANKHAIKSIQHTT